MTRFNVLIQDGEKHTATIIGQIIASDALAALELAKVEYGVPVAPLALVVSKTGEDLAKRRKRHMEVVTANYLGVQAQSVKKERAKRRQKYFLLGNADLLEHPDLAVYEVV